jgi:3-dehydroquinate dehydratase / shikimate dehydrogenase
VPKEDLGRFMEDAAELDIRGLSITIPHKEAVIEHLSATDAAVQGIGAANTVVLHDGQRLGYNTDCQSAMESLEEAITGPKQPGSPLRNKTVLVLGAGGVGKAIAFGLVERGANVVLSDGDADRAHVLASRLRCRSVDWSIRTGVMADVVVNCTPIGMHPEVDETPLTRSNLRPTMVVFDAVYNPENTLLIKEARQRGCKVVTGVDMFVRQAALQFKFFTGQAAPTDLMRDLLKRATSAAK